MPKEGFLDRMRRGYRTFKGPEFAETHALFAELADIGQSPKAVMIACCDSRVHPALITQAEPGELFLVRNVANIVPPYEPDGAQHGTSAALEFAINGLGIRNVIVMGHAKCGGVRALIEGERGATDIGEFIPQWMSTARDAYHAVSCDHTSTEDLAPLVEREVVRMSLKNLRTFPWIADLERKGELALHGWYFDIGPSELLVLDEKTGEFSEM
jgi:carbonic anhydrase